jgi:hypothetical protein
MNLGCKHHLMDDDVCLFNELWKVAGPLAAERILSLRTGLKVGIPLQSKGVERRPHTGTQEALLEKLNNGFVALEEAEMLEKENRNWITLSEASSYFSPTLKSYWPYSGLGLTIGILLLTIQYLLARAASPSADLVLRLVEHLGVGFIVASIAVFFYEWGSEEKNTKDLNHQLTALIEAEGEKALAMSLETLLAGQANPTPAHVKSLVANIQSLVKAVSGIQRKGTWAKREHVTLVSKLLEDVVVFNAWSLSSIVEPGQYHQEPGDYHFRVPPTGGQVAGMILAAEMRSLDENDSYDTISHLTAWKHEQLSELHSETNEAVKRGAKVRRVFNLVREYDETVTAEEATATLTKHLQDSAGWSTHQGERGYEVKVLGQAEFNKVAEKFRQRLRQAHFGIFVHGNERLRVKVERSDLADMIMSQHLGMTDADRDLFDDAWRVGTTLTAESIGKIIDELKRKMRDDSSPKGNGPMVE